MAREHRPGEEGFFAVRFWGVRGSIPVSGPMTAEFGGATICLEITLGASRIIVDAGSGIRRLGLEILKETTREAHILLTHLHLDHIIGLTAFAPFFVSNFDISLYAQLNPEYPLIDALKRVFSEPLFPVHLDALVSQPKFIGFQPGEDIAVGAHKVRSIRLRHGIGSIGYRIDYLGRSVVIITDHEHPAGAPDSVLAEFARNADLVIYDAMWDESSDYRDHIGWGHSTWQAGVALARNAGAKRLACIHHAPGSEDETLKQREIALEAALPGSFFARQSMLSVIG